MTDNTPPPDGTAPENQQPAYPDGPKSSALCKITTPSINPLDYLPAFPPLPELPSLPSVPSLSLPFTVFDCSKSNPTKLPETYGGGRKGTKPPTGPDTE